MGLFTWIILIFEARLILYCLCWHTLLGWSHQVKFLREVFLTFSPVLPLWLQCGNVKVEFSLDFCQVCFSYIVITRSLLSGTICSLKCLVHFLLIISIKKLTVRGNCSCTCRNNNYDWWGKGSSSNNCREYIALKCLAPSTPFAMLQNASASFLSVVNQQARWITLLPKFLFHLVWIRYY